MTTVLLTAVVFAGCGEKSGGSDDACELEEALCDPDSYLADHHCIVNDVRPRVYAPDTPGPDTDPDPWQQGDWWQYSLDVDREDLGETKLVYYDDQDFVDGEAQHYMVGTPTREEALHHAVFSTNPVVGRVHRTLYSPHEQGAHADMFYFPLCEGTRWQTTFFDTRFTLTASQETLQIPGGQDPLGFRITGTASDGSRIVLTYSPQVKWFTLIDLDRADQLNIDLGLTGFGAGETGEAFFLRGQKDVVFDLSKQPAETPVARENGKEGPYDTLGIALDARRTSGDARLEVHVRDPGGTSVACVGVDGGGLGGQATECPAGPLVLEVPWQAGEWTVTVERGVLGEAEVRGEARLVSIYDRSGRV